MKNEVKSYVVRCLSPGKAVECYDLAAAIGTWSELDAAGVGPRIYAVHADGTETPLPTYEEALAEVERLRTQVALVIADAPTGVYQEGRRSIAAWLRDRAAEAEAEIDDDCDGVDADAFCEEAKVLREAAAALLKELPEPSEYVLAMVSRIEGTGVRVEVLRKERAIKASMVRDDVVWSRRMAWLTIESLPAKMVLQEMSIPASGEG